MRLEVRKAESADLPAMMAVYGAARRYMKAHKNASQWYGGYPSEELIRYDISVGRSYVLVDADGAVRGAFVFITGEEPDYRVIHRGAWINDAPYGTIHRLASDGSAPGVFACCLDFCRGICGNIRADTHKRNQTMLRLLEEHGFTRCGLIRIGRGGWRIAYQLCSP